MRDNKVLQELILTDDSLLYCATETFNTLVDSLKVNKSLRFLDFSRNMGELEKSVVLHTELKAHLDENESLE